VKARKYSRRLIYYDALRLGNAKTHWNRLFIHFLGYISGFALKGQKI
jgi:hypothetical protein